MSSPAKRTARRVLRTIKKKPDVESLKHIIENKGFTIIEFNRLENPEEIQKLFSIEEIRRSAERSDAFIFVKGDCRLLFIADSLNSDDLFYVLCHELGHILDEGLSSGGVCYTKTQQERFANEFAFHLMHSGIGAVPKTLKKAAAAAVLIITVTVGGVMAYSKIFTEKEGFAHLQTDTQNAVFVTKAGECYHKKTCSVVKYRTNISGLSMKQAVNEGYRPCGLCFSELNEGEKRAVKNFY